MGWGKGLTTWVAAVMDGFIPSLKEIVCLLNSTGVQQGDPYMNGYMFKDLGEEETAGA